MLFSREHYPLKPKTQPKEECDDAFIHYLLLSSSNLWYRSYTSRAYSCLSSSPRWSPSTTSARRMMLWRMAANSSPVAIKCWYLPKPYLIMFSKSWRNSSWSIVSKRSMMWSGKFYGTIDQIVSYLIWYLNHPVILSIRVVLNNLF